jgi:hypothetical protein
VRSGRAPAPAAFARPSIFEQAANPSGPPPDDAAAATLTLEELAEQAGIGTAALADLEKYGLISGRPAPGGVYYDHDALVVAQLAARFMAHGVEARHLRMYRTSAEREAGFFEQLIMPMIKQRNPTARRQAVDNLAELARLGGELRAAMLRQALHGYTD